MAYRPNPFSERTSERTVSDQHFAALFSPQILSRLDSEALAPGVRIFRSPPGAGKTTLLRVLTPGPLRAFWDARHAPDSAEACKVLFSRGVLDEHNGPAILGVLLSCASGYADLPPGATALEAGMFRALLDCRIVLRALRSLAVMLGSVGTECLRDVTLDYGDHVDLTSIPPIASAFDLLRWAEQRERKVYAQLDAVDPSRQPDAPSHPRLEGVLWLQCVRFVADGEVLAPKRLIMIDDVHKLRRKQRSMLFDELIVMRPNIPVWLAERTIALRDELISQGVRSGRELREYPLDWSGKGEKFSQFAQNVLERRLNTHAISGSFSQFIRNDVRIAEVRSDLEEGIRSCWDDIRRYETNARYRELVELARGRASGRTIDDLYELQAISILLKRDSSKRQTSLDFFALSSADFEDRETSSIDRAAEIFAREYNSIPYYFGMERLCAMATENIDELLFLAAALYEGVIAKQILRKEPVLSAKEQERILCDAAKRRRDFIPKNHTEGTRAQRLLDAIGLTCREKTFEPNAPIAPGLNGVRLSDREIVKLQAADRGPSDRRATLVRVLGECVAENLLVTRASAPSASRRAGTVFYLNRGLCAYYGLPLQYGGWRETSVDEMVDWMESETPARKQGTLEMR